MKAAFCALLSASLTVVAAHCKLSVLLNIYMSVLTQTGRHAARPDLKQHTRIRLGVRPQDGELQQPGPRLCRIHACRLRSTLILLSALKVTDVTSDLIRCYETDTASSTGTATVSAGATVGFQADSDFYHPGVSTVMTMCQL